MIRRHGPKRNFLVRCKIGSTHGDYYFFYKNVSVSTTPASDYIIWIKVNGRCGSSWSAPLRRATAPRAIRTQYSRIIVMYTCCIRAWTSWAGRGEFGPVAETPPAPLLGLVRRTNIVVRYRLLLLLLKNRFTTRSGARAARNG